MYVNRLIEFAEAHGDKLPALGFTRKKIDWVVDVEKDGFIFSPTKKECYVPVAARSSNTKPFLIFDKPDYVFGMYEKEKDENRSKERHEAYKTLLDEYVKETKDRDVKLLCKLLDKPVALDDLPNEMKMGDFIIFRMRDEDNLHESSSVEDFWGKYVEPQSDKKETVLPCMFCHTNRPIMERHTIDFLIGPDRTKMISANKNAYESHGLKSSLSAPTCYICEQKYGRALEYLLLRNKNRDQPGGPHMFRVGDLTYVYWLRGKKQLDNILSLFASPTEKQTEEDVKDLLNQAFQGMVIDRDMNDFCVLSLTSNKGRLVVRDFIEDSVGNIKERIEKFFYAQSVGNKRYYGIYTLAATMYTEPRNQMQKYVLEEWMGWFLYGRRLSGRILIPILKRIQSEGRMYPQHAAAVKSWLVSQDEGVEWTMSSDNENKSDAYKTGRVFSILEAIQRAAIDSDHTIAAKFFGSASTTPRAIMGLLIRNAQHHLAKLRNDDRKIGIAINLERDLGQVLGQLKEFPSTLGLTEQGEFALGYYYERQKSFTSKKEKGEKIK